MKSSRGRKGQDPFDPPESIMDTNWLAAYNQFKAKQMHLKKDPRNNGPGGRGGRGGPRGNFRGAVRGFNPGARGRGGPPRPFYGGRGAPRGNFRGRGGGFNQGPPPPPYGKTFTTSFLVFTFVDKNFRRPSPRLVRPWRIWLWRRI